VKDPENGFMGLRSEIYLAIWRRFKELGIEIPYPQRDVRIVSDVAVACPARESRHDRQKTGNCG
jgi:small-conductance mechanosensitive channel